MGFKIYELQVVIDPFIHDFFRNIIKIAHKLQVLPGCQVGIKTVPQQHSLYSDLTARENLELMGNLYDVPKKIMDERIDYYLKLVNLESHAERFTGGFSGGMKQRLSVICAVIHDPEILFWDEPTTGLGRQ